MTESDVPLVAVSITQATYDAIYAELARNNEEHAMPYFIENTLRRWLKTQAYYDHLAAKNKDDLTEDEVMDLANSAVHMYRDAKNKPKGF